MSVSREHAQVVAGQFAADYPGVLQLAFYFRPTVADLYGRLANDLSAGIKGGYLDGPTEYKGKSYSGRVDVPLDNMVDVSDLMQSLRHEVLGHFGVNTLAPEVKRALLDAIIASEDEPSLKPLWAEIDEWYPTESLDVRAEEVFTRRCETLPAPGDVAPRAIELGRVALQDCCVRRRRQLTLRDLGAIACMVADGLRDRNRKQLTFLGVNDIRRSSESLPRRHLSASLSGEFLSVPKPVVGTGRAVSAGFRPR